MTTLWKHLILALLVVHLVSCVPASSKPTPKLPPVGVLWQGSYGQLPTPVPLGGK